MSDRTKEDWCEVIFFVSGLRFVQKKEGKNNGSTIKFNVEGSYLHECHHDQPTVNHSHQMS
jgi:hypothetical protein